MYGTTEPQQALGAHKTECLVIRAEPIQHAVKPFVVDHALEKHLQWRCTAQRARRQLCVSGHAWRAERDDSFEPLIIDNPPPAFTLNPRRAARPHLFHRQCWRCTNSAHQGAVESCCMQLTERILKNADPVSIASLPAWCICPTRCTFKSSATSWRPPFSVRQLFMRYFTS